jgi:hypothetical protein
MSHRAPCALALLVASGLSAAAQPTPSLTPVPQPVPRPAVLKSFGIPDANPAVKAPLARSRADLLAAELITRIEAFRGVVEKLPRIPKLQRAEIIGLADTALKQATKFDQTARRTADSTQLFVAHHDLDAALSALIHEAQPFGVAHLDAARTLSAIVFTDRRLHAALAGGDANPDRQREVAMNQASTLVNQSDLLRQLVAQNSTPGTDLTASARRFNQDSKELSEALNKGVTLEQARKDYAKLATHWRQVEAEISPVAVGHSRVRLQAAQVGALFRSLGASLGAEPPAAPPAFGIVTQKNHAFVVGAGGSSGPRVRVFHDIKGGVASDFFAYDSNFRGGVRVAVADLNGDGFPEIVTAPGKGMAPRVRVFDGRDLNLMAEFMAFEPTFRGGVFVAASDLTPDGRALVAVGADAGGGPHVRVFDVVKGKEVASFFPYAKSFTGGVRVALGDVDGDGTPDLVTAPGPGMVAQVRVFNGATKKPISQFNAYGADWTGGAFVGIANVRGKNRAELMTGTGAGGPALVRVFDVVRGKQVGELAPYPKEFTGGVRVAAADTTGDGTLDIICAPGPSTGPPAPVRVFNGKTRTPLGQFEPFEPTFTGGDFIAGR